MCDYGFGLLANCKVIWHIRVQCVETMVYIQCWFYIYLIWYRVDYKSPLVLQPGFSLHTFAGHCSGITSLDFHPKKTDLLCSCDSNGEIRYWNVSQLSCMRAMKGGTAQVRFQPNTGQFLAAATENVVSIFDVETNGKKYTLQVLFLFNNAL
jgi:WD40 repeat protein